MAAGDIIMSQVTAGSPSFPCGPCVFTCAYTGNLDAVISGINICVDICYYSGGGTTNDVKITAFTGINGSFTAAFFAAGTWQGVIGTATVTTYDSSDGSCSGEIVFVDVRDVILTVFCTDDGDLQVFADLGNTYLVFQSGTTPQTIDTPIPNTYLVCGLDVISIIIGIDGTVTISIP